MEIKDKVLELLKKEEVQSGLSLVSQGASIGNPQLGALVEILKEAATISDEIRVKSILKGLASGLNQESYTNELYNYIKVSNENAINVVNTLRKALISDSEIVCVLMGRILADHMHSGEKYQKSDVLIFHALENATDDDLLCFWKMFKNLKDDYLPNDKIYSDCVEWGISNRLLAGIPESISYGVLLRPF